MSKYEPRDVAGREAFKRFESLLEKVQLDSPLRARGAELTVAKRAYQAFLLELQPHGQYMIDRVIGTLDGIRGRLQLPQGYSFANDDYHHRRFSEFRAGEIQHNRSASLYIRRDTPATESDPAFSAEIRLFTNDVHVFVPAEMRTTFYGYGSDVPVFDSAVSKHESILYADSYDALADAVVAGVQARLDALPEARFEKAISESEDQTIDTSPEAEEDSTGMKP